MPYITTNQRRLFISPSTKRYPNKKKLNLNYNSRTMVFVLKKGASKKEMDSISNKLMKPKGVDAKKYCGTIKLQEDLLIIQPKMRDE